jgi:hypothetical protein
MVDAISPGGTNPTSYLVKDPKDEARAKLAASVRAKFMGAVTDPSTYVPKLPPLDMVGKAAKVIASPFSWLPDAAAGYVGGKIKASLEKPDPDAEPPETDLESKRAAEQQTGIMEPSPAPDEPPPAPKPRPTGGGYGGPAGPSATDALMRDFQERNDAMEDERQGRIGMAENVSGALGNVADEQRIQGAASMGEARQHSDDERAKIAEIDQLNKDYANSHIDPRKAFGDMNAPQAIATMLGGLFAGMTRGPDGGPKAVQEFYNNIVERSIKIQQFEIQKKQQVGLNAENLLASLRKTSGTEQEANDKARAVLIGATMTEVQKAGAAAKGPIEEAQVRELMADLKTTRDMALAKLKAAQAGAQAAPGGWLETDPNEIVNIGGQEYLSSKGDAEGIRNNARAVEQLEGALKDGVRLVKERGALDYLPLSANIMEGEAVNGRILQYLSHLNNARGVPLGIEHVAKMEVPDFGSRGASFSLPKAEMMLKLLQENRGSMTEGLRPIETMRGPGMDKSNKNKLTTYARESAARAPQSQQQKPQKYGTFQPGS